MLRDIDETFRTLRRINMKLNPKKCTFGAVEGMFLGYMISPEGIKLYPDKTEVVLQLSSPWTIEEVQSLNRKLASLNRFLSKSAEKSLPLFKTLKKCIKNSDFHWTPEVEQAFKQLKQHLSELPLLVASKPKEELIVYMFASHGAISVVLMTERGTVQTLVYFILTDFLLEKPNEALPDTSVVKIPQESWTLFSDGSSRVDGSGAGLILTSPEGTEFTYALRFQFTASNNEAEYEALIAGLRIAAQIGICNVHVSVDSKLVANQVLGTYVAKEENMVKYLEKAKNLISGFANFSISQVPKSKNKKADALSKITSTSFAHLSKRVLVEVLKGKSIQEEEVVTVVKEEGPTWMTPIIEYLKDGTLPDNKKEASKLRIKARRVEAKAVATITGNQQQPVQGLVWKAEYYTTLSLSETSAVEWTRGTSKPELGRRNQGPPRQGKQELDRRTSPCPLGPSVRGVTFRPGDFVYRSNEASHAMDGGKLGQKLEGPYEVMEALRDGAYKLRSMDDAVLPRTWNIANLKKCYL
ncbi:reverse transcriptase domain-containing protein [Tanacetum coccineum]